MSSQDPENTTLETATPEVAAAAAGAATPTTESGAPSPTESAGEGEKYYDADGNEITKSAWKKLKKIEEANKRKAEAAAARAAAEAEKKAQEAAARAKAMEEAKSIVLVNDEEKLGAATPITIQDVPKFVGQRVMLQGWCHRLRRQGGLIFIELRDGTGFPLTQQCVLEGPCAKTYNAFLLNREATVKLYGTLKEAVLNKKGGYELSVDYWELVQPSHSSIELAYNSESGPETLLDQRHLVLRETKSVYIMRARSLLLQCFREHFWAKGFYEVTPPTIVQNQVEGGSTLFKFDYFGTVAYLTQSSQLYLETVVPVLGKVFCCMPSYRAENSHTRRHLSEFTHFEGEMGFITFEDLIDTLEDMVVNVAERLLEKCGDMIREVNPSFKVPEHPFLRMNYADAVDWLREHGVKKEDGTDYEFGDDIPEAPERFMTDTIGKPIFLCRFPTSQKPFYMYRDPKDPRVTESVDLLMPGVGEIIGGSMRAWDLDLLLKGFEHEKIDPSAYYWYNDLRKYGSCPHGGWGLGMERYICWLLGLYTVREACLYPRFAGRARP